VNHIEQFKDAIRDAGLIPPPTIEADGTIKRFSSNGKPGDNSGSYVLHTDGVIPAGWIGDWRTGISTTWRADIGRSLTPAEEAEHSAKVETMNRERKVEESKRQAEAREKASLIWAEAKPCVNHPYLISKDIAASGARIYKDSLVIPVRDGDVIHSLQFISGEEGKKFLSGGKVQGCYFSIGSPKDSVALCIVEGFATGATIHEATGYPVAVAFNAGNLVAVAKAMREKFPDLPLFICGDLDESGIGQTKANEAALAVSGLLATPPFTGEELAGDPPPSDFNDYAALHGLGVIEGVLLSVKTRGKVQHQPSQNNAGGGYSEGWPQPQPLTVKAKPEPYPLDALPGTIQDAVAEVATFVQAPLPLVASSALTAMSIVSQALADVQRDEILTSPVGVFLLGIADSGERKTQADKMFSKPIQDYQDEQAEEGKITWAKYKAEFEAWEAKRGGIKDKIRQLAKGNQLTADLEARLHDLENEKPEPPRIPKLIREDATPEGLAKKLQMEWPSAGVVSNEAGIVFGAHGMGKESVMRNLALLNKLWDGGRYQSDRSDEERSRDVRGARLTMGLMIQEATLRAFFDQSKGLARGCGFLARFLISWPESTMGTRFYTPPIEGSPALSRFNRRITTLLNQDVPINENGILNPPILALIEAQLANGGELYDIRDVASKVADNAARLAALFQLFEGSASAVGVDAFESASRVAAWHLNEAKRFFGELALPVELADAARLDNWLIDYCNREQTHFVGKNHTRRNGPLRNTTALEHAIRELTDLDRIQLVKEEKPQIIKVNPALLLNGGI